MRDIELELAAMLVFPNDSTWRWRMRCCTWEGSREPLTSSSARNVCVHACERFGQLISIGSEKSALLFFSFILLYVSSAALWSWTKNHCHGSRSSLDLTLIEVAVELSKWLSLVQPTSSPRQETKKTLHRMLHGLWVLICALHSMNVRAQTALFSVSALEL